MTITLRNITRENLEACIMLERFSRNGAEINGTVLEESVQSVVFACTDLNAVAKTVVEKYLDTRGGQA